MPIRLAVQFLIQFLIRSPRRLLVHRHAVGQENAS